MQYLQEHDAGIHEYICMTPLEGYDSLPEIMDEGIRDFQSGHTSFQDIMRDPDEMAELLFTSGTTSKSKAVMLSPHNLLFDVYAMIRCEDLREGDVNMNFLPYHHTFGSISVVTALQCGIVNVYCDGLRYIKKNLMEYNVTMFVGVPLLVEQMYKNILTGVRKQGKESSFQRGLKISRRLRSLHIDVRRRMFKDVISQLGNLRLIISGASPLDPEVAKGFDDIGVQVIQGYGLTETSPVICAENLDNLRPGSVGKTMAGIEARIVNEDADGVGELVVKGPNVMLGYYKNEEATREALDAEGWYHTGDLATMSADGHVFIRGRIKNMLLGANGQNVYPEEIEDKLNSMAMVCESLIVQRGDKLVGLVFPDFEEAKTMGFNESDIESVMEQNRKELNEQLPPFCHLSAIQLQHEEFQKTPKKSIKRYLYK